MKTMSLVFRILNKNKNLILVVICFVSFTYSKSKGKLDIIIQPWYTFHENGSWSDSGKSEFDIHRAKFGVTLSKKIFSRLKLRSKLTVDFSERNFENILENAYIRLKIFPLLNFKFGKFKIPFGANNLINSMQLNTVYRSFTTDHLKNELNISNYAFGGIIFGKLFDKISFSGGLFQYCNNTIKGFHIKDIADFPVFSLSYKPIKNFSLDYMITTPQAGSSKVDGPVEAERWTFHDFSVQYTYKNRYEIFFEAFKGVDTSDVKKALITLLDYNENIAYSFYNLHSYSVYPVDKYQIKFTVGFEYINGLNYYINNYYNRSFYFSLLQCINIYLKKNLRIQLSYDTQYDDDFSSIGHQRITAQLTYKGSLKF